VNSSVLFIVLGVALVNRGFALAKLHRNRLAYRAVQAFSTACAVLLLTGSWLPDRRADLVLRLLLLAFVAVHVLDNWRRRERLLERDRWKADEAARDGVP
jgi:hypothetical protein